MGINTGIAIADHELTDEELAALGLRATHETLLVEDVILTPAEERVCVVRRSGATVIVDGGDCLAEFLDEGLLPLPGAVHTACVVSTTDFADYRVQRDGQLVRRLTVEDGEIAIDEGDAAPGEKEFRFAGEDGEEVDGDLLVQELPGLAGVLADQDLFTLSGDAWTPDAAADPAPADRASTTPEAGRRQGFFGRLLGR